MAKKKSGKTPTLSARDAARLLIHGQALSDNPANLPPATPRAVAQLVQRMGFVQVDTISTVERAHHLILASRLKEYRPAMLARVLEKDRQLFEHWTHDASIIPLKWYPHWRIRFERRGTENRYRKHLGSEADKIVAGVVDRITREGPLSSRDFEHTGPKQKNNWWGWKPHKIALDHLWRAGVLHIAARNNFHKVYDLTHRVIPRHAAMPTPTTSENIDWACRTALERLGTATVREIAHFWNAISIQQARAWVKESQESGEIIEVQIASADDSPPRQAYAMHNVAKRIADAPPPPAGMRLLCPFDPVLRDRARAKRLFNFDFRFEGFVPAARRTHGYYVMAIFNGERFVGKVDPKFDRASNTLKIGKTWWEPGVKETRKRKSEFEAGVEKLASWIGADSIEYRP